MNELFFAAMTILFVSAILAQQPRIPASYSNLGYDPNGKLYVGHEGKKYLAEEVSNPYTIEQFLGNPTGTESDVRLDFGDFKASKAYGLIPNGKAPHPLPVYRKTTKIDHGKVGINIKDDFKYPYDFVDWEANGYLNIGYRLADEDGMLLFDGVVALKGEGPFVS